MNRTVFITGGSSGIGRATACLFAQRGWRVGLVARGEAGLSATAAEMRKAGAIVCTAIGDVADAPALQQAAHALQAELGAPDVWTLGDDIRR